MNKQLLAIVTIKVVVTFIPPLGRLICLNIITTALLKENAKVYPVTLVAHSNVTL